MSPEAALQRSIEIFNLRDDLYEKQDLAKDMPDKANAWGDSVGAALPKAQKSRVRQ